jgi:hypothetical protein
MGGTPWSVCISAGFGGRTGATPWSVCGGEGGGGGGLSLNDGGGGGAAFGRRADGGGGGAVPAPRGGGAEICRAGPAPRADGGGGGFERFGPASPPAATASTGSSELAGEKNSSSSFVTLSGVVIDRGSFGKRGRAAVPVERISPLWRDSILGRATGIVASRSQGRTYRTSHTEQSDAERRSPLAAQLPMTRRMLCFRKSMCSAA